MQWAIAPIKIELDACDGHEFEAVDAETLQIVEGVDDAIESVIELLDLEFVDHKIIELRCLVVGVRPFEREESRARVNAESSPISVARAKGSVNQRARTCGSAPEPGAGHSSWKR